MFRLVHKIEVFVDGRHNAFTDLAFVNNTFLLVFRNATSHSSYDGRIMLMTSQDGRMWTNPRMIADTPTDDRDPKLFVHGDRIFCTFQTRWSEEGNPNRRNPMVCHSSDGLTWSDAVRCYEPDYVPWRVKVYQGRLYNAFYRYDPRDPSKWRVVLAQSQDGLGWEYVSTIYLGDAANETELHFLKDGSGESIITIESV